MDAQVWDELYSSREQLFSGNPNGVLVTEAGGLRPGRALDLGCGEGADAHWLAEQGWQVTAVDISRVALQRAAAATTHDITWQCSDVSITPPPADCFDLVSGQYFHLLRQPGHAAMRALLQAVAPGGTLLISGHELGDVPPDNEHGFDPSQCYQPTEIAGLLDDGWRVQVNETRPRTDPTPEGTHHTHDIVLRAQRLQSTVD